MKDCMFQYATQQKVYENTKLITLEEAKELFEKYRGSFVEQLERDNNPEMVIWINCKDEHSYCDYLHYWNDDMKVIDGILYQRV